MNSLVGGYLYGCWWINIMCLFFDWMIVCGAFGLPGQRAALERWTQSASPATASCALTRTRAPPIRLSVRWTAAKRWVSARTAHAVRTYVSVSSAWDSSRTRTRAVRTHRTPATRDPVCALCWPDCRVMTPSVTSLQTFFTRSKTHCQWLAPPRVD